jgi:hypothetical protein
MITPDGRSQKRPIRTLNFRHERRRENAIMTVDLTNLCRETSLPKLLIACARKRNAFCRSGAAPTSTNRPRRRSYMDGLETPLFEWRDR